MRGACRDRSRGAGYARVPAPLRTGFRRIRWCPTQSTVWCLALLDSARISWWTRALLRAKLSWFPVPTPDAADVLLSASRTALRRGVGLVVTGDFGIFLLRSENARKYTATLIISKIKAAVCRISRKGAFHPKRFSEHNTFNLVFLWGYPRSDAQVNAILFRMDYFVVDLSGAF